MNNPKNIFSNSNENLQHHASKYIELDVPLDFQEYKNFISQQEQQQPPSNNQLQQVQQASSIMQIGNYHDQMALMKKTLNTPYSFHNPVIAPKDISQYQQQLEYSKCN